MKPNVYRPNGSYPLTPSHIAIWANRVAVEIGGAKSSHLNVFDFMGERSRLNGFHCNCGTVDGTQNSPSLGEFELLPLNDETVKSGMKAYMVCRKCGCMSHL